VHQHEMAAPVRHEASRHDPEKAVVPAHVGTPASAQGDGELLPQQQALHHGCRLTALTQVANRGRPLLWGGARSENVPLFMICVRGSEPGVRRPG
jgi:hypothetical protein